MTKTLVHQPEFFPWINLFIKIGYCDFFIFLDSVQYSRRSFQNRNKISTKDGEKWLTVPIKKTSRQSIIKNIEINYEEDWQSKHLNLIYTSYKNSNNFNYVRDIFYCDTNKIIINPLSNNQKFLENNYDSILCSLDKTNVFFLQPSLKQKRDSICLFIKKFENHKNISFVS